MFDPIVNMKISLSIVSFDDQQVDAKVNQFTFFSLLFGAVYLLTLPPPPEVQNM